MSVQVIDSFSGKFHDLSNFARMTVPQSVRRERFFYVEVPFQALKAADTQEFRKIMETNDPKEAKRLGRQVKINVKNWDLLAPGVMYSLLEMKFFANPGMAETLKSTGNAKLIEGNHRHDNYWGDCRCGRPECAGTGKNMLGKLLMRVRTELRTYYPGA